MSRLMTITRLLAGLLLLTILAASTAAMASNGRNNGTILVVGDSLSAAYRMNERDGWVYLLSKQIRTKELPYEVINASVSGETTAGGLSRLPALLETHSPQIVILQLGGNDGLRGLPVPTIRQNLLDMVRLSQQAGAQVLLAGIQIPPNYGPRYTEPFAAQYGEIAESEQVPWLPFLLEGVAEYRALMQDDGIHPTEEAQAIILDNVWPVLIELL